MADRIQIRRDTEADWESNDPTLASGEIGHVTDTDELVVGDGSTAFTSLVRWKVGGPVGGLDYAEVTSNQTVANNDGETDLTGLTVTVDVAASRRIRVSAQGGLQGTDASDTHVGRFKESTTTLGRWANATLATGDSVVASGAVVLTPSAGSHTYKLSLDDGDGSGGVVLQASATNPAYILCEDLGPA